MKSQPIQPPATALISGVEPLPLTPRQVAADLQARLSAGAKLRPAGEGKEDPVGLLKRYVPRHKVQLFAAHFWLCDMRHDFFLNFLVGYVGLEDARGRIREIVPRLFYKDASLVWRVASHFVSTDEEHWIGKGDVRWEQRADGEYLSSAEETTNLPYEIQGAFDDISRSRPSKQDKEAVHWIVRRAKSTRMHPFSDFQNPRKRAAEKAQINQGRPVARFQTKNVPESLAFTKGFEPDLQNGLIEVQHSASRLYGGPVEKFRILSINRKIQYQFVSTPTHVFVNHPQALTTELMNYGTRTLDVFAPDDGFVPGFEYHFMDESTEPPTLYSQIPEGFAGTVGDPDSERADASPWIERLPIVLAFRREVLGQKRARRAR